MSVKSAVDDIRTSLRDAASGLFDGGNARTGTPVAFAAAVAGVEGLVYVVGRFVPELLRSVGAGPVVVGLYGTVGIALALLFRSQGRPSVVDDSTRSLALVAAGLGFWSVVPLVGSQPPVPAWAFVFVGLGLVAFRYALPAMFGDAVGITTTGRRGDDSNVGRTAGTFAAVLATTAVMTAAAIRPSVQILSLLAAVVGVAAVALTASDGFDAADSSDGTQDTHDALNAQNEQASPPIPLSLVPLQTATGRRRAVLVGDLLRRFALALVVVFVVVTVVSFHAPSVAAFGSTLPPNAVFGILLCLELAGEVVGRRLAPRVTRTVGRRRLAVLSVALTALFPVLLVTAPAKLPVLAMLFFGFGFRRVGTDARRSLVDAAVGARSETAPDEYRAARDLVVVPAPVVGGMLFWYSPVLAFSLATAVGGLALREYVRLLFGGAPTWMEAGE
ncbi:hypothetical protein AUR64_02840 [Haloprofundus marisrubri]|uniref:MFS transporter n=1 Tax=Haloprofundus marisrubri TaxID=1514971 RepID=A0A0W1R3A1_9EURY|nr:hypothetical protein [Haloprofundus marisrubri]KTG07614.1 hypothetical protein AUR64_02840 [Haloprofundus marisrubri]